MKMKQKINDKHFPWTLLWLCLLFIVPLCTASMLYLFRDNFPLKIIPNGQLLTPPVSADSLGLILPNEAKGKWQLIYLCDTIKTKEGEAHYDLLKRIHLLLGKDQTRVVLSCSALKNPAQSLSKQSHLSQVINDNQILLLDPRGFIILHYSLPIQNPKGMLEDIRRLLRYSHVG